MGGTAVAGKVTANILDGHQPVTIGGRSLLPGQSVSCVIR